MESQISEVRAKEQRLMFWNIVVKVCSCPQLGARLRCLRYAGVPWDPSTRRQPTLEPLPSPPQTINITMVFGVPPLVLFAVLVPYELNNENADATEPYITPTTAFTMLSLFNVLRFPLVVLPKALRCVSEALNSIRKLEKFLGQESAAKHDEKGAVGGRLNNVRAGRRPAWGTWSAVVARASPALPPRCQPTHALSRPRPMPLCLQAVLKHLQDESPFQLRVPEFSVAPGELVAVVGRVGAGKSSLLQALLGNMTCVEGTCTSGGKISYVPQTAWCQNLTLKVRRAPAAAGGGDTLP